MKTHVGMLLILLVITISLSQRKTTKKKNRKTTTATDRNINVSHWERYGLKGEISLKSFRRILEKVAEFDSVRNCPLGEKKCDFKSIDYVLPRLILKSASKATEATTTHINECIPPEADGTNETSSSGSTNKSKNGTLNTTSETNVLTKKIMDDSTKN